MSRTFTPQPGTAAALAIAALGAMPAGARVRSKALAAAMGITQENLGKKLASAVDAGLIEFHPVYAKVGEWSLTEDGRLYLAQGAVVQGLKRDLQFLTGLS